LARPDHLVPLLDLMRRFILEYLDPSRDLTIVDLGSQVMPDHDSYRTLCSSPKWTYVGCDIVAGNNVDLVLANAYDWKQLAACSVDVGVACPDKDVTEITNLTKGNYQPSSLLAQAVLDHFELKSLTAAAKLLGCFGDILAAFFQNLDDELFFHIFRMIFDEILQWFFQ